jgi:hypothetical protein
MKTFRGVNRPQCNTANRTHQFKVHKINCGAEILMGKIKKKKKKRQEDVNLPLSAI